MPAHVPPEDDGPEPLLDGDEDEWEGQTHSEAMSSLNDQERPTWLWCPCCEKMIDAGHEAYRQAARADEWAERPDREQAGAGELRQRKVEAIAAEHARRQTALPWGAS